MTGKTAVTSASLRGDHPRNASEGRAGKGRGRKLAKAMPSEGRQGKQRTGAVDEDEVVATARPARAPGVANDKAASRGAQGVSCLQSIHSSVVEQCLGPFRGGGERR